MNDAPDDLPEPANLRFLRRLVTLLTAVMIGGVLLIVALLVMRLTPNQAAPALPDQITLPDGATATGFTVTDRMIAIVTEDNRILIYDPTGQTLRQTIEIDN